MPDVRRRSGRTPNYGMRHGCERVRRRRRRPPASRPATWPRSSAPSPPSRRSARCSATRSSTIALAPLRERQRGHSSPASGSSSASWSRPVRRPGRLHRPVPAAWTPRTPASVVDACFARWQAAIEAHGGVVEKFIGDAVMAVFGLHRSYEDDAERAVRAALAMTRRARPSSTTRSSAAFGVTPADARRRRHRRVVVSTLGERRRQDFVAVGPTVNRAGRGSSPPRRSGGVLISDRDPPAGPRRVQRRRREARLELKGLDEPVDAYPWSPNVRAGFRLDQLGGVEGIEARPSAGRRDRCLQERSSTSSTRAALAGRRHRRGRGHRQEPAAARLRPLARRSRRWCGGSAAARPRRAEPRRTRPPPRRHRQPDRDRRDRPAGGRPRQARGGLRRPTGRARKAVRAAHRRRALARVRPRDRRGGYRGSRRAPERLRDQATVALGRYFARLAGPSRSSSCSRTCTGPTTARCGSSTAPSRAARQPGHGRGHDPATLLEERPRGGGARPPRAAHLAPLSRRESRPLLLEIAPAGRDPPMELVDIVVERPRATRSTSRSWSPGSSTSGVVVPDDAAVADRRRARRPRRCAPALKGVLQARLDALDAAGTPVLQRASVVGRVFWDDAVDPPAPSGRRRADTGRSSSTCAARAGLRARRTPRSTRPASSSSSTPCCATSPTTASARPTPRVPPAGGSWLADSPPARDASRSTRRSSPSTSTWPTTRARRLVPAGRPSGQPVFALTRRPTCSSAPSNWWSADDPGAAVRRLPGRTGAGPGPSGRPDRQSGDPCAGWPNCPDRLADPDRTFTMFAGARAGRRSRSSDHDRAVDLANEVPAARPRKPASAPGWPRGTSGRGRRSPGTARALLSAQTSSTPRLEVARV